MPKYQVWIDKGVKLAGKWYRHGTIIDSDAIGKPEPLPPFPPGIPPTEEQKQERAAEEAKRKTEAEEKSKQLKEDFDAAVKAGYVSEAKLPEQKNDSKKKEG